MNTPYACINSKALERLQAGHLWIYRSDVSSCDAPPGSIVSLYAPKKRYVGRAFYSADSLITLRLLTVENHEVDRTFWTDRLARAWGLRQRVVSDSEVYRLVHAEGDGLPSIIVDRYGDVLSLQTLSQGAEQVKPLLTEILIELFRPSCVIERNDSRVRELEGLPLQSSILYGSDPGELVCRENGLRFYYQPASGQKTGAFLDQRENRARAGRLASGKALDCFCYAGGFAVHLARSCGEVEAFDLSESAIQTARLNAELNGFTNLHFEVDNVFDRLRLYDNIKKRFDTIILDPPAFAKNRSQVTGALRGYKEINLRALRLLNPGGILVTSTCSQHIDETTFLNLLSESAADARRKVQVVLKATQGQDHPFLLSMPETLYLKCMFLRVIE